MRFEILGPIRIIDRAREVALTAGRERTLLAVLLLHANQTVPVTHLVDALWAERTPGDARTQLHGCVSRLRRKLASLDATGQTIITDPEGYRLRADTTEVDLLEFRALVTDARSASRDGRQSDARAGYRKALDLWRGQALAGIDRGAIQHAAAGLEEEHAQAVEERIDLELALGAGGELVGELTDLVHLHPYRERLHGALMLALYRADRQADAFAAYQRIRRVLVTELGQEPGPALHALHQRILLGDQTLRPAVPAVPTEPASHCLPRTVADFTGRDADLARLVEATDRAGQHAPLVLTIDGMPGVGKTCLAVHAAHLLAARYPDGQLFVDLQGHGEHPPVEPLAALDALLRQLGLPAAHIPAGLDERVARWRHELAGRRVLVVLDNAASAAHVTPLLPGEAGCLALVTSRRRLLDLDGAPPLAMETLCPDDAVKLLERIAGDRVREEPDAAAEVAERCGYLPLALRLAGARLAHRPHWRVRDLADRLCDPHPPLAELTAGDRTVAGAFSLSYRHVTPAGQRMFRRLGLHPGETFDAPVAAALADIGLDQAGRLLDELVDGHMVEECHPHRYRLHDLVRVYATQLAMATDPDSERTAAVERLLDYYLHAATTACANLETANSRRNLRHREPIRPDLVKEPRPGEDTDWLEAERSNLTAAIRHAASNDHPGYAWQLARAISRFLYLRGYQDDLLETHQRGLAAAERLQDTAAAGVMHNYLGAACYRAGEYDEAAAHVQYMLTERQQAGDRIGQAMAHRSMAVVHAEAGRHGDAAAHCQRALAAARTSRDIPALAHTVVNAGDIHLTLGRYAAAAKYSRRGVALARQIGDGWLGAIALGNVGIARGRLGQVEAALRILRTALIFTRRAHHRQAEADFLNELGSLHRQLGDFDEAVACQQQALVVVRETGFRSGECAVYHELGRTLLAQGDVSAALELHRRALALATRIRHPYSHAQALDGIATCLRDTDPESARRHWVRALRLYRELDVPARHEVERHLAALG